MIRSMTGYGRGRATLGEHAVAVEVRSVNGRGREVRFRLPSELIATESLLREQVQAAVARGRVDVAVRWEGAPPTASRFALNAAVAASLLDGWRELRETLGIDGDPTPGELLRLPGVIEPLPVAEIDVEALAKTVGVALAAALQEHRVAREREGTLLADDLRTRSATIVRLVGEIKQRVGGIPERLALQLRQRVALLLGESPVDESRLAQEIAQAAQRADVTEEAVRLDAHLARLSGLLAADAQEIGQALDFLVQEIRREVNTLTVKSADPEVDERALQIKSELERLREQAANLE